MDEEKERQDSVAKERQDSYPETEASVSNGDVDRTNSVDSVNFVKPKVHFNYWSTLGLVFSIAAPPVAIGLYLSLVVGEGGFPYFVWGFLFAGSFQLVQMFAQAELASAIPHSSGPAYWVQHLAPEKAGQFLGYLVGWLTVALYWFVVVADCLYLAQLCLGTAVALNPGYNPPAWHYYLVYIAWAVVVFVNNLPYVFKILPPMYTAATFIINGTALYLLIALLVRANPKPSAQAVFVDVVNETGWSSNGVVFFIALLPGFLTCNFFDSITHITDEVDNPTKQVPQVMLGYGFLAFVTGFGMAIALSFSTVNAQNLLTPYGHQPLIQVIFDASRSNAIATVGSILVIFSLYVATAAAFTSWNRLYWSFSREGGLPFPRSMSKLSSKDSLPVNAMVVNLFLVVAIGAIQLGSDVAINAIASGASVCLTLTYMLVFGCALWRGRDYLDKNRWLNLGRFGVPVYVVGFLWNFFMTIWLCLPLYMPVTLDYMNWGSLVFGGVVALALLYWFVFRKTIKHV